MKFNAQFFNQGDFSVEHLRGQGVDVRAVAEHTAGFFAFVKNSTIMSILTEMISCGQAGGAGADDGDFFTGIFFTRGQVWFFRGQVDIGDEAF